MNRRITVPLTPIKSLPHYAEVAAAMRMRVLLSMCEGCAPADAGQFSNLAAGTSSIT
ncbi:MULTISPECIES: hypothetical protein [unclassified Leisingera]|uniref:hypothetical protein n=1 Tax=unclassified Leisingera TaxID=2614906 RepID=UPI0021A586A5|nr:MULTISPECIES: hypothetical protein [unclassified Leisingera]UWQ28109.1 hypothetical protein K3557_15200 [Leisingera sp. M523]UWQ75415.1 hypothetical protein K3724_02790 [Leisingera sp. M658]